MSARSIETRLIASTTAIANGTHTAGTVNGSAVDLKDAKEATFALYIHTDNGALTWKFQESADGSTGWTDCLDQAGAVITTATDGVTAVGTYHAKILAERRLRYIRPVIVVTGTNMQGSCHGFTWHKTHVTPPTEQVADGAWAIID